MRSAHHWGGQGFRVLWHLNQPKGGLGFGQLGRTEKGPPAEELQILGGDPCRAQWSRGMEEGLGPNPTGSSTRFLGIELVLHPVEHKVYVVGKQRTDIRDPRREVLQPRLMST